MGLSNKYGSQSSSSGSSNMGGNRGNTRKPNRPNRGPGRPKKPKTGPGAGAPVTPVTPDATTAFDVQDPEAFFRRLQQQAGFDPMRNDAYGAYLNDWAAQQAAQWNSYQQANPNNTLYDFAAANGFGQTATPGGATQAQTFDQFLAGRGINKKKYNQMKPKQRNQLNNAYTTANPAPTFNASAGLQNLIQTNFNSYTPEQLGMYNSGKAPGSIRYNLFG
jgi:hypothetical protein